MARSLLLLCCIAMLAMPGCKKSSSGTTCTQPIYGFTMPLSAITNTPSDCTFGAIDFKNETISSTATFKNEIYQTQTAYNSRENCYYVFRARTISDTLVTLLRIDANGSVTPYTHECRYHSYQCLLYDAVFDKLYCIQTGSGYNSLAEISFSDSAFTIAAATTVPTLFNSTTCNTQNGDVYMAGSLNSYQYRVYAFHPGTATYSTVGDCTTMPTIGGLCFNPNDNMLYGVYLNTSLWTFVQINPTSGRIKYSSTTVPYTYGSYSAAIDKCSNNYLLSIVDFTSPAVAYVIGFDMYGKIVQRDATSSFWQGLASGQ